MQRETDRQTDRQMFDWSEGKANPTHLEGWLFARPTWRWVIQLQQI